MDATITNVSNAAAGKKALRKFAKNTAIALLATASAIIVIDMVADAMDQED